jgi:hypothetical protein
MASCKIPSWVKDPESYKRFIEIERARGRCKANSKRFRH